MNEKEKMLGGNWYLANDPQLVMERTTTRTLLQRYNLTIASDFTGRDSQLRQILADAGSKISIEQPFRCYYGKNIEIGENFFSDFGLTILDAAKVKIGNNVKIGPNCNIYTTICPKDVERRNQGLEQALPVTINDGVWIGGNVTILPGVSIGENAIIGAGSVVTKNVPANSIYAGVPAKMISTNYDATWQAIVDIVDKTLKGELTLSASNIQKAFSIGYGRATYFLTVMEDAGIVKRGNKDRYELAINSTYDINIPDGVAVKFPEDLSYYSANWQMIIDVIATALKNSKTTLSLSQIQRQCHIGYGRATKIVETMEANNIIKRERNNGRSTISITVSSIGEIKVPRSIKVKYPE